MTAGPPPRRTFGQWWQSSEPHVSVSVDEMTDIATRACIAVGANPNDATFLAAVYLDKAVQGDHTRGLRHLVKLVHEARAGSVDLHPEITVVRERPATAVVDGGPRASGRLVCRAAMALAIAKAGELGVAMVGARASGGGLGPYVRMATDVGMVGMAMAQSVPTVAPIGGYEPLLGNAPMAWGVPSTERPPVICDMSFTQTSASPVLLAAQQGEQIPLGLVLDAAGRPTIEAAEFPDLEIGCTTGRVAAKGSLVPLGGSHKGFAMVFVIGLLSSLLTETSPPWDLCNDLAEQARHGTVLLAIDPTAFDPSDAVGTKVDAFCNKVESAPRQSGVDEILYPGLWSQQLRTQRRAEGWFDVPRSDYDNMAALASELDIPAPVATATVPEDDLST